MANFITIENKEEQIQDTYIQNNFINNIKKTRNEISALTIINENNNNDILSGNLNKGNIETVNNDYTTDILFNTNIKRDTTDLFEGIKETYVLDIIPEKWEDGGL